MSLDSLYKFRDQKMEEYILPDPLVEGLFRLKDIPIEKHFTFLLKIFLNYLKKEFKLHAFSCFKLNFQRDKYDLTSIPTLVLEELSILEFTSSEYHSLIDKIPCQKIKKNNKIYYRLSLEEKEIHVAYFNYRGGSCFLWVWRQERRIKQNITLILTLIHQSLYTHMKTKQLEELVYRDELTGLFNYRFFQLALEAEIKRAERSNRNFGLMFLDLDNFKCINDQYGHSTVSSLLQKVAQVLCADLRRTDIIIRWGGDEYVIIVTDLECLDLEKIAQRVCNKIAGLPFYLAESNLYITASIGLSSFPNDGRTVQKLLDTADLRMYLGKKNGKNRVVGASAELAIFRENSQSISTLSIDRKKKASLSLLPQKGLKYESNKDSKQLTSYHD